MGKRNQVQDRKNDRVGAGLLMGIFICTVFFCQLTGSTAAAQSASGDEVKDREDKTLDLLSRIDAFTEKDEQLRLDAAKAHYNMGNIYFQKGEFELASREYYQAVTLMPDDADAHYNLAFISSEHLNDYETALKHFQMYLYLNPTAKDAYFVKEKISNAEMKLQTVLDSPLEEDAKP